MLKVGDYVKWKGVGAKLYGTVIPPRFGTHKRYIWIKTDKRNSDRQFSSEEYSDDSKRWILAITTDCREAYIKDATSYYHAITEFNE